jgi:hypothetical protein
MLLLTFREILAELLDSHGDAVEAAPASVIMQLELIELTTLIDMLDEQLAKM